MPKQIQCAPQSLLQCAPGNLVTLPTFATPAAPPGWSFGALPASRFHGGNWSVEISGSSKQQTNSNQRNGPLYGWWFAISLMVDLHLGYLAGSGWNHWIGCLGVNWGHPILPRWHFQRRVGEASSLVYHHRYLKHLETSWNHQAASGALSWYI